MKLLTCEYEGKAHLGALCDDTAVYLPALDARWRARNLPTDMLALIDAGAPALDVLRAHVAPGGAVAGGAMYVAMNAVRLLAPIPRPRQNVLCLGWNYQDHVTESATVKGDIKQTEKPDALIVFTKSPLCVCGPYDDIPYDPEISKRLDWEAELAVVIGRAGHKVAPAEALDYIFGYTAVNDISARELQKRHRQFYLGKSVPKSCPMGPYIVTPDEVGDAQSLRLRSRVNGVTKQDASTADQIFDIKETIATISKSPAIAAGDIIATGTPAGVGFARKPPEYLRPGDVAECEVEKIGVLRNRIVNA